MPIFPQSYWLVWKFVFEDHFALSLFLLLTSVKNGWTQMPGFVGRISLLSVTSRWLEPHLHVCISFLLSVVSQSVQWLVCWQMAFPLNKIQWLDVPNIPEGLWNLYSGQWLVLVLSAFSESAFHLCIVYSSKDMERQVLKCGYSRKSDSSEKPFTQNTCSFWVLQFPLQ